VYSSLLALYFFNFSGLTCDWTSGVGRLDPFITSGNMKNFSVNSENECRAHCMQQTSFICASINYRTDDGNCQLLAENTQTATISSSDIVSGDTLLDQTVLVSIYFYYLNVSLKFIFSYKIIFITIFDTNKFNMVM